MFAKKMVLVSSKGSKVARSMLTKMIEYRQSFSTFQIGFANPCSFSHQLTSKNYSSISDVANSDQATTPLIRNATQEKLGQIRIYIQQEDLLAAENMLLELNMEDIQLDSPIFFFNQLLAAYANTGQVHKLLSLFQKLLDDPKLPSPDEFSLNVCLKILPYDEAYSLLQKRAVQDLAKKTAFNTVIAASCKNKDHKIAIQLLEIMMEKELEPNNFTITPIIELLGKVRKAPKAQLLFDRMIDKGLVPDLIMWTVLLHCWATSKRREAAQKTMELLNKMHQQFDVEPDTVAYNAALLAFANDLNRGKQAEQLLRVMTAPPNTVTYAICIKAWTNSPGSPEAVERSEALVREMLIGGISASAILWSNMISLYARRGLVEKAMNIIKHIEQPNVIVYTTIMEAWANSNRIDAFENAYTLLQKMEVNPNITTFNTLIKVVEKNPGPKIKNLREIKLMLERNGLQANVRTYNAMYAACSAATGEDASLQFMLDIYEEMKLSQIQVDNYTFPSIFKVLANLEAPFTEIDRFFQQCIANHAVSRMVISHLKRSCSTEQLQRLLPVRNVYRFDMNELPRDWWNLKEKLRRERREGRR